MCFHCRAGKARDEWVEMAKNHEVVTLRDQTGDSWDPGHPTVSLLHLMRDFDFYVLVAQTFNDIEEDRFNAVLLDRNIAIKLIENLARMVNDDGATDTLVSEAFPTYQSLVDWGHRVVSGWYSNDDMDIGSLVDEFEAAFAVETPGESPGESAFHFDPEAFGRGLVESVIQGFKDLPDLILSSGAHYDSFLEFGTKPENEQDSGKENEENQGEESRESKINPIGWEVKITPIRGE